MDYNLKHFPIYFHLAQKKEMYNFIFYYKIKINFDTNGIPGDHHVYLYWLNPGINGLILLGVNLLVFSDNNINK